MYQSEQFPNLNGFKRMDRVNIYGFRWLCGSLRGFFLEVECMEAKFFRSPQDTGRHNGKAKVYRGPQPKYTSRVRMGQAIEAKQKIG
jgi:hypothetical protein